MRGSKLVTLDEAKLLTFPVRLLWSEDTENVYASSAMGRLQDDLWRYSNLLTHSFDVMGLYVSKY